MQARPEEIEVLFQLQQLHLDIIRLTKELEELPQRQVILNARKKREGVKAKQAQIEALRKDTQKKLTRVNDEDASLQKKENGVQAAIEAAGNDFRNVESRTKELDGIFRRRGELAKSRETLEAELGKIKTLSSQVSSAIADLDLMEEEATESFKKEGGALKQAIADTTRASEALKGKVSAEVSDFYSKTAVLFDTVCIGKLDGSTCSVCRTKIEPGRLLHLKSQAPLTLCPSCKRILVIEA